MRRPKSRLKRKGVERVKYFYFFFRFIENSQIVNYSEQIKDELLLNQSTGLSFTQRQSGSSRTTHRLERVLEEERHETQYRSVLKNGRGDLWWWPLAKLCANTPFAEAKAWKEHAGCWGANQNLEKSVHRIFSLPHAYSSPRLAVAAVGIRCHVNHSLWS